MQYRSTDNIHVGGTVCNLLLKLILGAPRLVVIPQTPEDRDRIPTLIMMNEGRVDLIRISYRDNFVRTTANRDLRYELVLERRDHPDIEYIFEFKDMQDRHDMFYLIVAAPWGGHSG